MNKFTISSLFLFHISIIIIIIFILSTTRMWRKHRLLDTWRNCPIKIKSMNQPTTFVYSFTPHRMPNATQPPAIPCVCVCLNLMRTNLCGLKLRLWKRKNYNTVVTADSVREHQQLKGIKCYIGGEISLIRKLPLLDIWLVFFILFSIPCLILLQRSECKPDGNL